MNLDESLRAKNVAEEDPAPMDDTLGGYPWLPRMIDKARAARAGSLGPYFRYPCPMDRRALDILGLTYTAFQEIACNASTGRAVLSALTITHRVPCPNEAWFDPIALNTSLHSNDC